MHINQKWEGMLEDMGYYWILYSISFEININVRLTTNKFFVSIEHLDEE